MGVLEGQPCGAQRGHPSWEVTPGVSEPKGTLSQYLFTEPGTKMTFAAELALASVGVTEPQGCQSPRPRLPHYVAGACELHIQGPPAQTCTKPQCVTVLVTYLEQ